MVQKRRWEWVEFTTFDHSNMLICMFYALTLIIHNSYLLSKGNFP